MLATFAVTNVADSGLGSLRQAILDANANPNANASTPDLIEFNISGPGPHTVQPLTELPEIMESTVIDGFTQLGSSPNTLAQGNDASYQIVINGDLLTGADATATDNVAAGLTLVGNDNTVRGLVLNGFSDLAVVTAIQVRSDGNVIEGNFIGTNAAGTAAVANDHAVRVGEHDGSTIVFTGSNNQIGGTTPAARNLISGNTNGGVSLRAGTGNVMEGNYVGTDLNGTSAIPNGDGLSVGSFSTDNRIGGTADGAGNLVSGNIGVNAGIVVTSPGPNEIQGNLIGTDATGSQALGNDGFGIWVFPGGADLTIGGPQPGAGNVISGNASTGIVLSGAASGPRGGNTVQGNLIGTDIGAATSIPNGSGVRILSDNNLIGGTSPSEANIIAFNTEDGVRVQSGIGNSILGNSIHSNGGLGINLVSCTEDQFGVTIHDTGDADVGANNLQNFPLIESASAGGALVTGSLDSEPNTNFRIEFFANATVDPSGHGEGDTFLGFAEVTTNEFGIATFSESFSTSTPPAAIRATATNLRTGDTSEFSGPFGELRQMDYADAPDPYPTLCDNGGARHVYLLEPSGPFIGSNPPDNDLDGIADEFSVGDDNDASDDEDGLEQGSIVLIPGESYRLFIRQGTVAGGVLNAWMDFNRNGSWDDAGEQIIPNLDIGDSGFIQTVDIPIPRDAVAGPTVGRFRISTQSDLTPIDLAPDGEVEDHRFLISGLDFGDAPDSYETTYDADGARHATIRGEGDGLLPFALGSLNDAEFDGVPSVAADSDDTTGDNDDDGVGGLSAPLVPGTSHPITVNVTAPPDVFSASLSAWVDFNQNGNFDDDGELVLTDFLALPVTTALNFNIDVPTNAVAGDTYARFRLTSESAIGPSGLAMDGEVEDYRVSIATASCSLDVTTTTDGGLGSLREAIICANSTPGPNTISLPSATYTLDLIGGDDVALRGDLDITEELTIVGDDAETTIIDASGLDPDGVPGLILGDRAFHVHGVVFQLANVTIRGADAGGDGGGLLNEMGTVTLDDVIVDGNNALLARGGGVASIGSSSAPATLNLADVTISNNQSRDAGGGIFSLFSETNIIFSEIRDNRTDTSGGGIHMSSSVGIVGGQLNLAESSVSGNRADGLGGGIYSIAAPIAIRDSVISSNTAGASGGAILTSVADLDIIRSTLDGNTATADGGGILFTGFNGNIAETTVSNNQAGINGGGIISAAITALNIRNSTISGNSASDAGAGGGIRNGDSGNLDLLNTTITENRAGRGAGLDISVTANNTLLVNTIVAANTSVQSLGDVFGTVDLTSVSNLIGDGLNLLGIVNGVGGNQVGTPAAPIDPVLGPLTFNGGPNFTHLPLAGSTAIDAGENSGAPPIDQRGGQRPRPIGGDVDIGAVEIQTGCSTEVTTAADTFDVADGETSFREAIVCANLSPGPDTISFSIDASGVQTIDVGSTGLGPLPEITEAVTIDGYSQGGAMNSDPLAFNGTPLIELIGTSLGDGFDGLVITGGDSTVSGLVINRFNVLRLGTELIGGNAIILEGAGGNVITGNLIGTDTDGASVPGDQRAGILIDDSSDNTIGGLGLADRNVISGNVIGIDIEEGSSGNEVLGNLIGPDAAGTLGLSSTSGGISIFEASGNTIGGTAAGARNVISGNSFGITVIAEGLPASDNVVEGNYIGTDVTGAGTLGNDLGVLVAAAGNTIGGTSIEARNVISGNGVAGVGLGNFASQTSATVTDNFIQGNFIGVNAAGDAAIPNGGGDFDEIATRINAAALAGRPLTPDQLAAIAAGVAVADATSNTIGGSASGAGNVISGNVGPGISFAAANNNLVQGNLIGTDAGGTVNLGNSGPGVLITASDGNAIEENTIAFNGSNIPGTGVVVLSGTGNSLRRNSIFQNDDLGIDLADDGVTINDSGDADTGPNDLLNFPVLTSALVSRGDLLLSGFARPGVEIELFIADPDPSGFGEGRTFLATRTEGSAEDAETATGTYGPGPVNGLDQGTDTTNRFRFTIPVASLPMLVGNGTILTATATDGGGNTSEFSGNVIVSGDPIPPTVGIADAAAVVEGNNSVFDVTVSRPLEDGERVVVTYDTADQTAIAPGDYIAVSGGTITFNPGDPVTKTISITTNDDNQIEAEETFIVDIAATGVSDVTSPSATGTILDNDVAVISGHKYEDLNGNGILDQDDVPLRGWTIYLDGFNGTPNGMLDAGEPSAITDDQGAYFFSLAAAGTYFVTEVLEPEWVAISPSQQTVDVVDGQTAQADFFNAVPGSIHGIKFRDVDEDGIFDERVDQRLGGVEFTLSGTDGLGNPVNVGPVATNSNGQFKFENLRPTTIAGGGGYTVTETVPAGSTATTPTSFTTDLLSRQELVAIEGQAGLTSILRASVNNRGEPGNGDSGQQSISEAGRFVAYASSATNLVEDDSNGFDDIFVFDDETGVTERISVAADGSEGNGNSSAPSISDDGRIVAFVSEANNLVSGDMNDAADVFVFDRDTGTIQRISVDSAGIEGNFSSSEPDVSADGRFVAFTSSATNLVADDANNQTTDIFVHDRQTGTTERVNLDTSGMSANGASGSPSISADGRHVAFVSIAADLVIADGNGVSDVFVVDRVTGTVERASVNDGGTEGDDQSSNPSISADGSVVAFESDATNLVPDDTNAARDIFVADLSTGTIERIIGNERAEADDSSNGPSISADGRVVVFTSNATNLVGVAAGGVLNGFIFDRQTELIQRIGENDSKLPEGSNLSITTAIISADRRYVSFPSDEISLVPGETAGTTHIYLSELPSPRTEIVLGAPLMFGNAVSAACSLVVTTTDDTVDASDEVTSLREAIICANDTPNIDRDGIAGPDPDPITFAIPGTGVQTINVGSTGLGALPEITEAVIIDGYTQGTQTADPSDDAVPNTDPAAFNGTLLIQIDGSGAGAIANGLEITSGGSTVRGLVINRFNGELAGIGDFVGGSAILLSSAGGNVIEGNILGMDPAGSTDSGNALAGVVVESADNTIGGGTPAARNLIAGNLTGVFLDGAASSGNTLVGNLLGTNAAGTAEIDLATAGITISDASDNTVGGTTAEERNVIAGHAVGLFIISDEQPATGNAVQGNYIGTNVAGDGDLGNDLGVLIIASGNTVGGTLAGAGNVISGNQVSGVAMGDSGTTVTDNFVQGNLIGLNAMGNDALPNGDGADFDEIADRLNQVFLEASGESLDVTEAQLAAIAGGVAIGAASNNTVGGTDEGALNVISGNVGSGVVIVQGTGNFVQGNFIGTEIVGAAGLGNSDNGVTLIDAADNTIDSNLISGNGNNGVHITGPDAQNNLVQGNFVGTNVGGIVPAGSVAIGNFNNGVNIESPDNIVGGTTVATRNIISGNQNNGVTITGADATGNVVLGNYIGIDVFDADPLSNGNGVVIDGAAGNTIGGATAAEGNVISGNLGAGVFLTTAATTGNVVQHNRIGTDSAGIANVANSGAGVFVSGAASSLIADNTIAFNAFGTFDTGVVITAGTGNAIRRNSMFQNEGLGIDLADDGVTLNDTDDVDTGPNDLLNFPVLESATLVGTNLLLSGFARPGSEIELFIADPDPTGFGEGQTFLALRVEGSADDDDATTGTYGPAPVNGLDQGTDTTNRFSFSISIGTLPVAVGVNTILTATATDAGGNTSEFSGNVTVLQEEGPAITATKDDALAEDNDGDTQADPGDVIEYTVRIDNLGNDDATDVQFTDTLDPNTTLVPGSVTVTPLALDDDYSVAADMPITVDAAGGLLANDFDIDGTAPGTNAELTFVPGSVSRVGGDVTGTFTPDADGGFTYTPPIGARGTEVFEYNILDADNLNAVVPGFVTFNVSSNIWFIDNSLTTNGDGSLANPFNSLANVNGAGGNGDVDEPGDIIFVFEGNARYDQSIQLEDNQQLIGEGAGLMIGGTEVVPAGNRPTLTQTTDGAGIDGEAIRLANSNTIRGFNIDDVFASGIEGDTVAGGIIEEVTITSAGEVGIDLDQSTGTFTLSGVELVDSFATGLLVEGGDAEVQFGGADPSTIQTAGGAALQSGQDHTGTITITPGSTIVATGGSGLQFDNADGTYNFSGTVTLSGGDAGIDIIGGSSGTFTFSDTTITDPSGVAFKVENFAATGRIDYDGSINATSGGDLIDIDDAAAGSVINFNSSGTNSIVGDGAGGIVLFNSDGSVTLTTPITIQNPTGGFALTGISIFGGGTGTVSLSDVTVQVPAGPFNAGVEVNDYSGTVIFQDLDITTNGTGIVGLSVFQAGSVNVTGTGRVNSTGGDGIILNDVDSVDMTFESVTVNDSQFGFGGGSGVTLTNIGSGSFEVTGTTTVNGANGPAGIGIDIDNADGTFTFADVDIDGTVLDGVSVGALSGNPGSVSINGGTITNVGGVGTLVNNAGRASLNNTSVTGTLDMPAARIVSSAGTSNVSALNNVFRVAGGTANAVEFVSSDTGDLCLDAVGNDAVGSGGGFGLDFSQNGASILAITQADLTEFGSDNPATTSLNTSGTITFDCVIPLQGTVNATASPDDIPVVTSIPGEGEISPSMPLVIGTLPAGKAVQIVFQASINEPFPAGVTEVANQGTFTGSNFADVVTDDPATPAPNDPTITPIDVAVPLADLSIDKTVDNMAPRQGDQITFTVTLSNAGPDEATNIQVTDAIPAGLSNAIGTPSVGTYVGDTWSLTSLAASSSATLTIVGDVASTDAIVNTAEVVAVDQSDPDSTPGNNDPGEDDQDSVTATPAAAAADLSLTKLVDIARPNVGDEVTFTVTVNNAGPDAATGVDVTDLLPAGLMFDRSTQTAGNYNDGTGLWTVGALAVNQSETLTITALVISADPSTNVAEVTASDQPDPDSTPGNNVPTEDDQASVIVTPQVADLSIDKTVTPPSAGQGDQVTFTVTLSNNGPDAATTIQVADAVPAGLVNATVTPSGISTYAGGVWSLGSLASGGFSTLTIVGEVDSNSPITNTAEVIAVDQFDPDSTPGNNVPSEDDQDSATVTIAVAADLSLTKTVDNAAPNVGEQVTFTLTVANDGPDGATGVEVTDRLPAGLTFFAASPLGDYDSGSGVWTVGSLGASQSTTLTITATVDSAGAKTNVAQVSASDQPDPDSTPGNNVVGEDDQDSVAVTPQLADLSLVKTVDDASANVGDDVTFTLAVNNAGPDAATTVTVTDLLPAGLDFVDATGTGSYDDGTGIWTIGTIAAGNTVTLDIIATLTGETVTNIAEVATSDQFDPDSTPGNNVAGEDDQFSVSLGACLTVGSLTAGENLFTYSCVTPGGFAAFVMGKQPGSHFFDRWGSTVDIADPDVFGIGVGSIDGVAFALLELTAQQASEDWYFQAFEMVPTPKVSNLLDPFVTPAPVGVPLHAGSVGTGAEPIAARSLPPLLDEAVARWEAAGLRAANAQQLRALDVQISDLPGDQLASSHGNFILLDIDAAGHGWFIDATPSNDAEFARDAHGALVASSASASDRIDALTVLMHEMGHALGNSEEPGAPPSELMSSELPLGTRRLPSESSATAFDLMDVNQDGRVSALDALVIINRLSQASNQSQLTAGERVEHFDQAMQDYDVNDDGRVSALDALQIINHMSRDNIAAEAEALPRTRDRVIPGAVTLTAEAEWMDDELLRMMADDSARARLV